MDVELYVYDLSQGLARQYSQALTGVQIDAVYHTAIVFEGVEYFFGQGIHRKVAGTTHHGQPMKVVPLGRTELPREVIEEYLESLADIYTPESYDLFLHNCNNFSQDLAMFLVGKSIPEEIKNLPETFLRTPIGQMLRGQIDQSMRKMTQAPDAVAGQNIVRSRRSSNNANASMSHERYSANGGHQYTRAAFANGGPGESLPGKVHYPQNIEELDQLLRTAERNCAAIFFTSATCPPCKLVYPAYDELADEAGDKATLIKVDVGQVYDIAMRYHVRATPTFVTFLRGKKDQEWSGAHEGNLRGNIRLLVQMANPQHAHQRLQLPSLNRKIQTPIMYARVPPMEKLLSKIGKHAKDSRCHRVVEYIRQREREGVASAAMPDMNRFSEWFQSSLAELSPETRFALIDLVRIAAVDTRVSGWLATEHDHRLLSSIVTHDKDFTKAPYQLQAVTLQLFCNLFSSTVFQEAVLNKSSDLRRMLEQVASQCLLADHHNARSLAAALIYNMAAHDHNERIDGKSDQFDMESMDDVEAALVDAVVREEHSQETLHSLLMALGLALYAGPSDSSIWDLCLAMDVPASLKEKSKTSALAKEPLLREIGEELLAKGRPL